MLQLLSTHRPIATLLMKKQNAGTYSVDWNASNYTSGIYFYTIKCGEFFRDEEDDAS